MCGLVGKRATAQLSVREQQRECHGTATGMYKQQVALLSQRGRVMLRVCQ